MSQVLEASERTNALAPQIDAFDHLEWYVGNARHAAQFWVSAFGFRVVAYAGPETGARDRQSFVLRQGDICFVVTSALDDTSPVARHVAAHGDGVRVLAYRVGDVEEAHRRLTARGATSLAAPRLARDDQGTARLAAVAAYGDTTHSLVERDGYRGAFLPGYEPFDLDVTTGAAGRAHRHRPRRGQRRGGPARRVGRLVPRRLRVRRAAALLAGRHLHRVLGAAIDRRVEPRTHRAADQRAGPRPAQEPDRGVPRLLPQPRRAARGDDHRRHRGHGRRDAWSRRAVHAGARRVLHRGPRRLGALGRDLPWARLAELGILVDRDSDGYLLQIFTEQVASRPTAFMEIIQREGARGFGEGNFKALFTSIEAEQARRGQPVTM